MTRVWRPVDGDGRGTSRALGDMRRMRATEDAPRTRDDDVASADNMPTLPIPARRAVTTFDAASRRERYEVQPLLERLARQAITRAFGVWVAGATRAAHRLDWFPRVDPYVGYGTEDYSRLICRTVYAGEGSQYGKATRGIRGMLAIPSPHTQVKIRIDDVPLETVQVGVSETFDAVDSRPDLDSEYAISDTSGYLDLVAEHRLTPGTHDVSYRVNGRKPVHASLFTIPKDAKVGIISDVDDTIMITQAPILWKALWNLLFLNPDKKASVPGMSVLFNKLADLYPDAPFIYLSTSPWNVEGAIRHFIENHGFPAGPLLLRDLDPRPKTFIPSGPQHKLEFVEQLMADFPDMRFILVGDDGQKDPTTYATIVKRYPGRVLAIAIRQLSPRESMPFGINPAGMTATQPMPATDVPVFTGTTGANLMKTMLPYLKTHAAQTLR